MIPLYTDPSTFNSSTANGITLGTIGQWQGKLYRFVQNANGGSDNALADGDVVAWASATAYSVSNVLVAGGGSSLTGNPPAGVAVGSVTKNYYGWILIYGLHTNVKSTATTAGVMQKISATSATCTDQTAATIGSIGTALTATSGGRCTVAVRCM